MERVSTAPVTPMITGVTVLARLAGWSCANTALRITRKSTHAKRPPRNGDSTQLVPILASVIHRTAPPPLAANPNPATAPMMECVVDTGHPFHVAMWSQTADARSAASIPTPMNGPTFSTNGTFITSYRIVLVTCPPAKKAPENSKTDATATAALRVRTRDPTAVPIALATSFAPIVHAR
ncbi:MAG: hypothetical protein BWY06_03389 [Candidatus Latescibacteria bacterium ADurb.Bin168]|nr:MAG: hypothetical protein BWY06_03389 [Candidatus Latescibacteria bacterium ADurb.Bin168]